MLHEARSGFQPVRAGKVVLRRKDVQEICKVMVAGVCLLHACGERGWYWLVCRNNLAKFPSFRVDEIVCRKRIECGNLHRLHPIEQEPVVRLFPIRAARRVFRGEAAKSPVWLCKPDGVDVVWKELIEIKDACVIAMYRTIFRKERT